MDIVANAGAVSGRIIGSVNLNLVAPAGCRFARYLDEVRHTRGGRPGTALRVGAGNIEITQRHIVEIMRLHDIAQHDF
ncbi:hypothetical protein D3C86_1826800 [compost metagenome]